jgi:hypothetical protein
MGVSECLAAFFISLKDVLQSTSRADGFTESATSLLYLVTSGKVWHEHHGDELAKHKHPCTLTTRKDSGIC